MDAPPPLGTKEPRLNTLRRLIHREAVFAVAFVTMGFLALFFFFDLVDELRWIGRTGSDGYQLSHALLFVALSIPSHLYELLPITVLIGTIFVMLCPSPLYPSPSPRDATPPRMPSSA